MRNWLNLFEAFNNPVPIRWRDHSDDDISLYQADFQLGDGHYVVQFQQKYYENVYTIQFTRNNDLKLSNTGSATMVLATVMQAIREFIEARDPRRVCVSMDKSEPSRSSLYPKLAAMMMREFPEYAMSPSETRSFHTLNIARGDRPSRYKPAPAAPEPVPEPSVRSTTRSRELDAILDDELLAELLGEGRAYPLADRDTDGWYGNSDYYFNGGVIEWMPPDEYLSRVRPLVIDDVSRDNIDDLKAHIEDGRVLDPLVIYGSGKEDGRHRANAAKELGIKQVPVIIFPPNLNEGVERIEIGYGGHERVVKVWRNPTVNALEALGQNSNQGIVRFIINDGKIWFWDAYDSTHVQIGEKLGIDVYDIQPLSSDPMTGVMKMEPGSYDFDVGHLNAAGNMTHGMTKAQWKVLSANPVWARYASAMDLYPQYRDMDL
jgi:hypothetical protein